MKKLALASCITIITTHAAVAPAQEQLGSNIKPYRIVLNDFRVTKIENAKGIAFAMGVSKGRSYRVSFGQTEFNLSEAGKIQPLNRDKGVIRLKVGSILNLKGSMNPATAQISIRLATFR